MRIKPTHTAPSSSDTVLGFCERKWGQTMRYPNESVSLAPTLQRGNEPKDIMAANARYNSLF